MYPIDTLHKGETYRGGLTPTEITLFNFLSSQTLFLNPQFLLPKILVHIYLATQWKTHKLEQLVN